MSSVQDQLEIMANGLVGFLCACHELGCWVYMELWIQIYMYIFGYLWGVCWFGDELT